jgi:ABC-type sugar transport system substrate-binding protein
MKKILLVVLIAVLAIGMVSCSIANNTPSQSAAESSAAPAETSAAPAASESAAASEPAAEPSTDLASVVGSDGQPLLLAMEAKEIPDRPEDPEALAETDPLHWYDMEYAGWKAEEKENLPTSPGDGPQGKKVTVIINGDHPYLTAYSNGAKIAADALGMTVDIKSPNWDLNVQNQMVDQAINDKPDMIILVPLDPKAAVQQFRKINQAGIPVIGSNMLPDAEGIKYMLTWSGPDDFGQMAKLADYLGEKLGGKGGVAYITHNPGGSPYFARYFRVQAQLAKDYPEITTLDFQSPGFEADKAKQVVSDWITKFGDKLNAIVLADDSAQAIGAVEACKEAGREDIVIVAAGNSKVGMDYVKDGSLSAITYQSAEADGAIPIKLAADWFSGKTFDQPIYYLPQHVITTDDVDNYMPAQW